LKFVHALLQQVLILNYLRAFLYFNPFSRKVKLLRYTCKQFLYEYETSSKSSLWSLVLSILKMDPAFCVCVHQVFSCDSETEDSSRGGTPHLRALLLAARSKGFSDRAATVAECSLEASLVPVLGFAGLAARSVSEDGPNSAPEICDHSGLFEKIGQRFKQKSDRVHRVK